MILKSNAWVLLNALKSELIVETNVMPSHMRIMLSQIASRSIEEVYSEREVSIVPTNECI
jgi:hypothetical protein